MNRRITSREQCALNDERLRISRDIHDNLGARLTEMILLSDLARRNTCKADEVETHVGKISKIAREIARDLDAIIWAVSPRNDFVDNLATYIFQYAEKFLGMTPIRCRLDSDELPHFPVSSEARHNLFLVVKEALNNIVKHSAASEVWVRMKADHSLLQIEIMDNGKGFETSTSATHGNGLGNMQKRVRDLRGRLTLESEPGKGTRIRIRLRLAAETRTTLTPVLQAA